MYKPAEIESKWQRYWRENETFRTPPTSARPKYYVLDMFPYPSGAGLHLGHVEGYTATDIMARFKRMQGYDVLHPMGWDAFGLPAEQYAIEVGIHPKNSTAENVANFKSQCDAMGFSYDWTREINTSEPQYYRWTQWIFKKMLEKDLAYRAEALVNWCPALGTVLANDEVVDGRSERGGYPIVRKPLTQWMLRITAYAERLLADLDKVDYPPSIASMQRDRIGRSEGVDIRFSVEGSSNILELFTTRPETIFGATFCVLAPEHELVKSITTPEMSAEVDAYLSSVSSRSDIERTGPNAAKTGVFTGAVAINPASGQRIPILVGDYVLSTYGSGAIMGVPAHDQRDWTFAHQFSLPITEVIQGGRPDREAWEGDGSLINSAFLNGLDAESARLSMTEWIEGRGIGRRRVRYKMRDWIFARQRYWGEPVPVVYDANGNIVPVPDNELPIELPWLDDFKPSGSGEAPLERLPNWVQTRVPGTQLSGRRETHTMPTLAGSSWYFFRFIDPVSDAHFCDPILAYRWMPVDLYVGGAEHAVGHLLYARFFTKFLYDLGLSPVDEPFAKLINQGMILGPDHRKMSKRYGNTVNPADVIREYGADSLRIFEMFLGPLDADKPWNESGIGGARRFLDRVWRLFFDEEDNISTALTETSPSEEMLIMLNQTIKKVRTDTEELRFNTAIAQMMIFVNEAGKWPSRPRAVMEPFVLLLAPYAPHLAEEIWAKMGHQYSISHIPFPEPDARYLETLICNIAVQVNGRLADEIQLPKGTPQEEAISSARQSDRVSTRLAGRVISRVVFIQDRLINLVTQ